jgi:hypothetical protein
LPLPFPCPLCPEDPVSIDIGVSTGDSIDGDVGVGVKVAVGVGVTTTEVAPGVATVDLVAIDVGLPVLCWLPLVALSVDVMREVGVDIDLTVVVTPGVTCFSFA